MRRSSEGNPIHDAVRAAIYLGAFGVVMLTRTRSTKAHDWSGDVTFGTELWRTRQKSWGRPWDQSHAIENTRTVSPASFFL